MKKLKTQKGITLVALIITIVVLLILAMVTIGTLQESNIIGHAQNAAGSFNQSKTNEIEELAKYEETINKYIPKENNDIQYFTASDVGEGIEIVYVVIKENENYLLKPYTGNIGGQLELRHIANIYLEEVKTTETVGTGENAVIITQGAIGITYQPGGQKWMYIQNGNLIVNNDDGSALIMTKATADVISRLSEGESEQ